MNFPAYPLHGSEDLSEASVTIAQEVDALKGESAETPRPRHNNQVRARRAFVALKLHASVIGNQHEPVEAALRDLFTDLRHLVDCVDTEDQSFQELVEHSEPNYLAEVSGEQ